LPVQWDSEWLPSCMNHMVVISWVWACRRAHFQRKRPRKTGPSSEYFSRTQCNSYPASPPYIRRKFKKINHSTLFRRSAGILQLLYCTCTGTKKTRLKNQRAGRTEIFASEKMNRKRRNARTKGIYPPTIPTILRVKKKIDGMKQKMQVNPHLGRFRV
jgi:hypothetical protein